MKIGDYVRTKYGNIGKIIEQNDYNVVINSKNNMELFISKEDDIKSSPNIIDLLKPMDLIYVDIDNGYAGGIIVPRIAETYAELKQIINEIKLGNYTLKGVVTKEQIENCMYKVGG